MHLVTGKTYGNVLGEKQHYLFVAKPGDHKYLMEWVDTYEGLHKITFGDKKNRTYIYEWMNDVPLHGGKDSIKVNFFFSHEKPFKDMIISKKG